MWACASCVYVHKGEESPIHRHVGGHFRAAQVLGDGTRVARTFLESSRQGCALPGVWQRCALSRWILDSLQRSVLPLRRVGGAQSAPAGGADQRGTAVFWVTSQQTQTHLLMKEHRVETVCPSPDEKRWFLDTSTTTPDRPILTHIHIPPSLPTGRHSRHTSVLMMKNTGQPVNNIKVSSLKTQWKVTWMSSSLSLSFYGFSSGITDSEEAPLAFFI